MLATGVSVVCDACSGEEIVNCVRHLFVGPEGYGGRVMGVYVASLFVGSVRVN